MKKNILKRAWDYVWHGDSIGSLLISIVLVFVIVRYLIYPIAGIVLGTQFPIVAVVSGSMEHEGLTTTEWWQSACCQDQFCTSSAPQSQLYEQYNITLADVERYRFPNGFDKGDIIFLAGADDAHVGDTIVFFSERRAEPIIHRLIAINEDGTLRTKGDNNCAVATFEERIPQENVAGRAIARVPWLGYIKIVFVEFLALIGIGAGL